MVRLALLQQYVWPVVHEGEIIVCGLLPLKEREWRARGNRAVFCLPRLFMSSIKHARAYQPHQRCVSVINSAGGEAKLMVSN